MKHLESKSEEILGELTSIMSVSDWNGVGSSERDGGAQHDASVLKCGEWKELVLFGPGGDESRAPITSRFFKNLSEHCL